MTTKDEELSTFRALKLALEALAPMEDSRDQTAIQRAITAIREALAEQPEKNDWEWLTDQEIKVEVEEYFGTNTDGYYDCFAKAIQYALQEKNNISDEAFDAWQEKNKRAPKQPFQYKIEQPAPVPEAHKQQEPAGSVYRYGKDSSGKPWHGIRWTASGLDLPDGTLIYTSPPNVPTARASQSRSDVKPWVGLTSKEREELDAEAWHFGPETQYGMRVSEMTEAKLREKNEHREKNA